MSHILFPLVKSPIFYIPTNNFIFPTFKNLNLAFASKCQKLKRLVRGLSVRLFYYISLFNTIAGNLVVSHIIFPLSFLKIVMVMNVVNLVN